MSDGRHPRKRRTREHVIADLGVNFVERQILLAGFVAERERFDYGIDLVMKTFDTTGVIDPGRVLIQVKATDHFAPNADNTAVPVRVDVGALKGWLLEQSPVILALYDAHAERAYWLYVQEYAQSRDLDTDAAGETVTLLVPLASEFAPATGAQLRALNLCETPLSDEE